MDLNPALTDDTPISRAEGGRGLSLGSIQISDGTNKSIIDLSSAATIGDVVRLIEANPPDGPHAHGVRSPRPASTSRSTRAVAAI